MPAFLVDEDLPRSLAAALRARGHRAFDIRDVNLRGRPDSEVFDYAQRHGLALLTGDLGFANEVTFPPDQHHGVVLARFPNAMPVGALVTELVDGLHTALKGASADPVAAEQSLRGLIIVIEPGQVRIRRAQRAE